MYRSSSSGENIYFAVYLKFNSACVTIYELLFVLNYNAGFSQFLCGHRQDIYTWVGNHIIDQQQT